MQTPNMSQLRLASSKVRVLNLCGKQSNISQSISMDLLSLRARLIIQPTPDCMDLYSPSLSHLFTIKTWPSCLSLQLSLYCKIF